jgi:hypothetical protein
MEKVWSTVCRTLFKDWTQVLRQAKEGRGLKHATGQPAPSTVADEAAARLGEMVQGLLGVSTNKTDEQDHNQDKEGHEHGRARSGSVSLKGSVSVADLKLDIPTVADDISSAEVRLGGVVGDGKGQILAAGLAQSMLARRLGGKQKAVALSNELTLRYQLKKAAANAAGVKHLDRLPAMKRWDAESLRPMRQVFLQEWQALGGGVGYSTVPSSVGGLGVKEENVLLIRVNSSASKADSDTDSESGGENGSNDRGASGKGGGNGRATVSRMHGDIPGGGNRVGGGGGGGESGSKRTTKAPKGVWERFVHKEQKYKADQLWVRQQWRDECTRRGKHKVGPLEPVVRVGGPLSLDRAYGLVLKIYCARASYHEELTTGGGHSGLLGKGGFRQFVFQQMFTSLGSNTLAHTQLRSLVLTVARVGREGGDDADTDHLAEVAKAEKARTDPGRDSNISDHKDAARHDAGEGRGKSGEASAAVSATATPIAGSATPRANEPKSERIWHGRERSFIRAFGQFAGLAWDGLEPLADDVDVIDAYCTIVAKATTLLYDCGPPQPTPKLQPKPAKKAVVSEVEGEQGNKWGHAVSPVDAEDTFRATQKQSEAATGSSKHIKRRQPLRSQSHAEHLRKGGLYEQVESRVGFGGYPLLVLGTAHRLAVEVTESLAMNMATGTGGSATRWARRAAAKAVKAMTNQSFEVVRLSRLKLSKVETNEATDGVEESAGEVAGAKKKVNGSEGAGGKAGKRKRRAKGRKGGGCIEDDDDEADIETDKDGTRWRLCEEHTMVVGVEVLLDSLLPELCRRKRMEVDYFRAVFHSFAAGAGGGSGNSDESVDDSNGDDGGISGEGESATGAAAAAQGVAARESDERGDGSIGGYHRSRRGHQPRSARVGLDAFVPLVRATLVSCGGGDIRRYDEQRLREMIQCGQLPTDEFCTSLFISHAHGDDGIAVSQLYITSRK